MSRLGAVIREHADNVRRLCEGLVPDDRLPTTVERQQIDLLNDAEELIRTLSRMVDGKPLARAFGAPGDWGYGKPIGDALAAHYTEAA